MAMQLKNRKEAETRVGRAARLQAGSLRLEAHTAASSDGPEVRTCTRCGEHVAFRIDPLGGWAECPLCGHLS